MAHAVASSIYRACSCPFSTNLLQAVPSGAATHRLRFASRRRAKLAALVPRNALALMCRPPLARAGSVGIAATATSAAAAMTASSRTAASEARIHLAVVACCPAFANAACSASGEDCVAARRLAASRGAAG
eukprot:CAMPEP_0115189138 /NCGR_PEP_ID=MMETSP0270-20121206/11366_1 /TAXON_ID=71861 /ORGANISM="Scrippsiella trochoidea, Strain CCMP3099" /LENGTH=130 /DNA_ID=CAMNT_0002602331 /DNA_START=310 /DNA_END=702 /DNA_ORIENTATION=+